MLVYLSAFTPKIKETIITKITAPIIDGIIAIPATCGPHAPNTASPIDEPTVQLRHIDKFTTTAMLMHQQQDRSIHQQLKPNQ